jgi:mono/diheme cytochrome c family protein
MKRTIYSVVVLCLAGGAVCNNQKPVGVNSSAELASDNQTPAEQNHSQRSLDALSYSTDVKPFFTKHCVECHNGRMAKAGYNFDGYDALMKGGKKGPAVVAGEPDKSLVVRVLSGRGKRMPPPMYKHQPKAEDADLLRAWIAAGAKDDSNKVNAEGDATHQD